MNKDIFKNPNLYYIIVPAIIALWPLMVWFVYLPETEKSWNKERDEYVKSQKIMEQILTLDPERLDLANSKTKNSKFDFTSAIDSIASTYKISPTNYSISSKPIRGSGAQKTQNAKVILKQVDITSFAKFLSEIQLRWASLQCEDVTLTKNKGLPDAWKVDLDLKYYY